MPTSHPGQEATSAKHLHPCKIHLQIQIAVVTVPAAGRVGRRPGQVWDGKMTCRLCPVGTQRVPPFTHKVQTWIWERQNPPAGHCAEQQYLLGFVGTDQVLSHYSHGISAWCYTKLSFGQSSRQTLACPDLFLFASCLHS